MGAGGTPSYPGPVDDALDQEGDGVSRLADGLHSLLVTAVPQVHAVHLINTNQYINTRPRGSINQADRSAYSRVKRVDSSMTKFVDYLFLTGFN